MAEVRKPKTDCRASFLLPISQKAFRNSPTFLPASLPAGFSEKHHPISPVLVSLTSVDTTNYTYQPRKYTLFPFQKNVFLMTVYLGMSVTFTSVYYVQVGGLAMSDTNCHVLLMQNWSLPMHQEKAKH